jgi:hypothetical protein
MCKTLLKSWFRGPRPSSLPVGRTPPFAAADEYTFQNFALTDHAVIFFIGQGHLLGHPEGPLEVSVP